MKHFLRCLLYIAALGVVFFVVGRLVPKSWFKVFHTKIGVKLCSMAGGGVSRNLWNFFRTAPAGTGQAVTCSTSGMGLRLK